MNPHITQIPIERDAIRAWWVVYLDRYFSTCEGLLSETVAAPMSYVGEVQPGDDLAAGVFRFTDADTIETFACHNVK